MVKSGCVRSYLLLTVLLFFLISCNSSVFAFVDNGSIVQYIDEPFMGSSAFLNTTGATYLLAQDTASAGLVVLNVTKNNITIDGQGFTISSGSYDQYGISAYRVSGLTVRNITFSNFNLYNTRWPIGIYFYTSNYSNLTDLTFLSNSYGLVLDWRSSHNTLTRLSFISNSADFDVKDSVNNTFDKCLFSYDCRFLRSNNNTISSSNFSGSVLTLADSNSNSILNNNFLLTSSISLQGSSTNSNYNLIKNNQLLQSGIYMSDGGNYNFFENNTITGAAVAGVEVANWGTSFYNNTFLNNNIYNNSGGSFYFWNNGDSYNFLVYNNSFGEIKWTNSTFLQDFNVAGDLSFPGNITIDNNSAYFNSDAFAGGLINSSANITLFNIGDRGFIRPAILKDNQTCTDCINFTSLIANTVKFRVLSWSNYTIGSYPGSSFSVYFINFTDTSGSSVNRNSIKINVTSSISTLANLTIRLYNSLMNLINFKTLNYDVFTQTWLGSGNRVVNDSLDIPNLGLLWNYSTSSPSMYEVCSPVVSNGIVFICDNGRLYARNATTGGLIWNKYFGIIPFLYLTPAILNDSIYVIAQDGNAYAVNITTSGTIWTRLLTSSGISGASSPVLSNGRLYAGAQDKKLYALNITNGNKLWNVTTGGYIVSAPIVYNDKVYFTALDGRLYVVNATNGSKLWNYSTSYSFDPIGYSSPTVFNDIVYFGGPNNGILYALNATNGSLLWSYDLNDYEITTPVISNGQVYFASSYSGFVVSLNAMNGNLIWNYSAGSMITNSNPAIASDVLFVGSWDRNLHAINITTGEVVWIYSTGNIIESSPAIADGKVFINAKVGTNNANLYAFGSTSNFMSFVNLANGLYFFNSTACDSYGTCNSTETRNVTIDYHYCGDGICYAETCATCSTDCGVCFSGDSSSGSGSCTDTCSSLGFDCGQKVICGFTKNCGSCSFGQVCNSISKCVSNVTCTPSCPSASTIACGSPRGSDGCGGTCSGVGIFCTSGTCNLSSSSCISSENTQQINHAGGTGGVSNLFLTNLTTNECSSDLKNFVCGEYSACKVQYDVENLLIGNKLTGIQSRICIDTSNCLPSFTETQNCSIKENISVKNVNWCNQNYTNILNDNGTVVARINQVLTGHVVNLDFNAGENSYCAYCFDGVKDYDEADVDCGGSCNACSDKEITIKQPFYSGRVFGLTVSVISFTFFMFLFIFFLLGLVRVYRGNDRYDLFGRKYTYFERKGYNLQDLGRKFRYLVLLFL